MEYKSGYINKNRAKEITTQIFVMKSKLKVNLVRCGEEEWNAGTGIRVTERLWTQITGLCICSHLLTFHSYEVVERRKSIFSGTYRLLSVFTLEKKVNIDCDNCELSRRSQGRKCNGYEGR